MKKEKKTVEIVLYLVVAVLFGALGTQFALKLFTATASTAEIEAPRHEASTPFELFAQTVVPVLNRRCGNCHGIVEKEFTKIAQSSEDDYLLAWAVDKSGRISSDEHVRIAYDRSLGNVEGEHILKPVALSVPAPASSFLRAPLARALSNSDRSHPEIFSSLADADYRAIVRWIEAERIAHPKAAPPLEGEAEIFFANKVIPILERKTCLGANCHGQLAFNDLKLDPGIPALETRYTSAIIKKNRRAMLGEQTRLVSLGKFIEQSKQLLKNIPINQGGMIHKGGNAFFFKGDPDYNVLVEWLKLETEELQRKIKAPLNEQRGLIFVRRPRNTPERFFEPGTFLPGAELVWQHNGKETVLSHLLPAKGALDIRAPDVSYDATRVAFALRRSATEPFNIWEIDLHSQAVRQLTFSENVKHHFIEPLYYPDPDDKEGHDISRVILLMTSNHLGRWCRSSPDAILGEAESGSLTEIVDKQLTERPDTYTGKMLKIVRGTNTGESRRIINHVNGRLMLDRPLPKPNDSSTHYVIEVEQRMAPCYDGFRMRLAEPGKERDAFEQTLKRMTYSISQARRPSIRSDGAPVFSMLRVGWQQDRPFFNSALFRMHLDGSDFHPHNGNRSGVPIHSDDRELPNGHEIRIGRDADSYWGGMLMLSDHQFGITIEPNNPLDDFNHPYANGKPDSSAHRFVPGWIKLDANVTFKGVSTGGVYRDPYPMPDGSILVAYAPGPVDLADPEAAPNFDILRLIPEPAFQSEEGFSAGNYRREVIVSSDQSEVFSRPVVVRAKEPLGHKKLKTEESLFGKVKRVRGFDGYPDGTPAVAQIYDYYLIDAFFEQTAPMGQKRLSLPVDPVTGKAVPEIDQVKFVRVVAGLPQKKGDQGIPTQVMVAEVPLSSDGSFHVAAPSGASFLLQSLNSDRMALRSLSRWFYTHPGEKYSLSVPYTLFAQTCGGCHGSMTGVPTDTFRHVDAVTSASRTATTWDHKKHKKLKPINWNTAVTLTRLTYEKDIRPILEDKCVSCHSEENPAGGLALTGEHAFTNLLAFVNYREALSSRSYLIEKLTGKELHAPRKLQGDIPHPSKMLIENQGEKQLTGDELLTLIRWIDLGAQRGTP
ncbi:MAG: hypothetical protein DRR19_21770 [Candidatus Parabeggiatoa sp. nov. 1]|nr:MAG: hypothetical protein DRR19_21770 [Gammaproteobacteria bacterium]